MESENEPLLSNYPLEAKGIQQNSKSVDIFEKNMPWSTRKTIALNGIANTYSPPTESDKNYFHWHAYHQKLSTMIISDKSKYLKTNEYSLTPLIYAIWAREDLSLQDPLIINKDSDENPVENANNLKLTPFELADKQIVTIIDGVKEYLVNSNTHKISNVFSRKNLTIGQKLSACKALRNELGHVFAKSLVSELSFNDVVTDDNIYALQYLIESRIISFEKLMDIVKLELYGIIEEGYIECTDIILEEILKIKREDESRYSMLLDSFSTSLSGILMSSSPKVIEIINSMYVPYSKPLSLRTSIEDLPKFEYVEASSASDAKGLIENTFKDDPTGDLIINHQIHYTLIPVSSVCGSEMSRNLIGGLNSCENVEIFKTALIKDIIDAKWETLWIIIFLQSVLTWSNIPLLLLLLSGNVYSDYLIWVFAACNSILLAIELIQLASSGIYEYLGNLEQLPTYYLIKGFFIGIMIGFFYGNLLLLIGFSIVMVFLQRYFDNKDNTHLFRIEVALVFIGIHIWLDWGWWMLLILTIFAWFTQMLMHSNTYRAVGLLFLIYPTTAFWIWVEWDSIYFIIVWTLLMIFLLGMDLNADRTVGCAIKASLVMIIGLFQIYNLSIGVIFFMVNLASLLFYALSKPVLSIRSIFDALIQIATLATSIIILFFPEIISQSIYYTFIAVFILDFLFTYVCAMSTESFHDSIEVLKNALWLSFFFAGFTTYSQLFLLLIYTSTFELFLELLFRKHFLRSIYKNISKLFFNWNSIDLARLSLCIIWVNFTLSHRHLPLPLIYFLFITTLLRGLTAFRCFSGMRYYIRLVFTSISDIGGFIILFFYSTLAFGIINSLDDPNFTLVQIWITSYNLNLGTYDSLGDIDVKYLVFFSATIFNVIIMLNLLISILGDSFDKFQVVAAEVNYIEMTDVINEIETVLWWRRWIDDRKYFMTCMLAKPEAEETKSIEDIVKKAEADMKIYIDTKVNSVLKAIKAANRHTVA